MKRTVSLLLSLALMLGCMLLPGAIADDRVAEYDNGMTYGEGYPITKEVIELNVIVNQAPALRPNMATTTVLDYIQEKTNIRLNIRTLADADQRGLIFASRDYPDFAMAIGATTQQRNDAAEAGDLIMIQDLVDQFVPTYRDFFAEYSLAYTNALGSDGKLYSLPFCNFAPFDRDLRDMFMVNTKWIEELGLEIPTTTAEFKEVLKAFRDNAGTGTIPANVEPFRVHNDGNVGGYLDLFNFFGVITTNTDFMAVHDGTVQYSAVDPEAKNVVKYLADLYAEGLILPEMFTNSWDMHLAKISAKEATIGAFFAYNNENTAYFSTLPPLDAENGRTPTIRRQTYTANPNHAFMMFSNNKYPVATMRLMEFWVADPVDAMTVGSGLEGYHWEYNADGKMVDARIVDGNYAYIQSIEDPDKLHQGFWNSFIGIRTPEFYETVYHEVQEDMPNTRAWSFKNVYKDTVYDASYSYIGASLSGDDEVRRAELATEINDLRKTTFANWISGVGDIDAEWDKFVADNDSYGLQEYLALKQLAYDMLTK